MVDVAVAVEHSTDQEREEVALAFVKAFHVEFEEVGQVDIVFEFFAVISFHDDGEKGGMREDGACHAEAFEFSDIGAVWAVAWCAAGIGVIEEALVSTEQFGSLGLVIIAEGGKRLEDTVDTAAFAVEEVLGGMEAAIA